MPAPSDTDVTSISSLSLDLSFEHFGCLGILLNRFKIKRSWFTRRFIIETDGGRSRAMSQDEVERLAARLRAVREAPPSPPKVSAPPSGLEDFDLSEISSYGRSLTEVDIHVEWRDGRTLRSTSRDDWPDANALFDALSDSA